MPRICHIAYNVPLRRRRERVRRGRCRGHTPLAPATGSVDGGQFLVSVLHFGAVRLNPSQKPRRAGPVGRRVREVQPLAGAGHRNV